MSTRTGTKLDDSGKNSSKRPRGKQRGSNPRSSSGRKHEQGPSNLTDDEHDSKRSKSEDSSEQLFESAEEEANLSDSTRVRRKKHKDLLEMLSLLEKRDHILEKEEEEANRDPKYTPRPRRPLFKRYNFEARPIIYPEEVPADWHHEDTDIDEYDIDAMIERCEQRIDDAVLPQLWVDRLEQYQQMKANREALQAGPDAAFGVPVLARLQTLKAALKHIDEWGDVFQQKRNIEGIMKAYRSFDLWYYPGRVTYWYRGRQVAGPENFEWSRYLSYYNSPDHNGKEFCVEGHGAL
ncbi:uncharacterized protein N7483_001177 [Penicillium malachiteum]|uniref:uncharacterized protein n=1 Tax=Penicillium malachiteum TaxID=1324776 RepID=UPI002546FC98|nr:uncharacterized protein N7483_001177 [Penicillium malachiteum]KAJ5736052.1 hypothetical protein N7483_001177 [Penicillium malachiteum]